MHTEMKDINIRAPRPTQPYISPEDDPLWDALTSFRISMLLHMLLRLMPRFKDTLASLTSDTKSTSLPVNLAEPGTRPPLMDSQNPAVKIIFKGREARPPDHPSLRLPRRKHLLKPSRIQRQSQNCTTLGTRCRSVNRTLREKCKITYPILSTYK